MDRAQKFAFHECWFALTWLLLVLFPFVSAASSITGRVINRTRNQPSPSDDVVLYKVDRSMVEMARTKSGVDGAFRFDTSGNFPYLVAVHHQKISYHTKTLRGSEPVEIPVYDSTQRISGVRDESNTVFLQRKNGAVNVTEFFLISNQSNPPRTLAGDTTFSFRLPENSVLDSTLIQPPRTLPLRIAASPCGKPGQYCLAYPIRPGTSRLRAVYHLKQAVDGWISFPKQGGHTSWMIPESLQLEATPQGALQRRSSRDGLVTYETGSIAQAKTVSLRLSSAGPRGVSATHEIATLKSTNLSRASTTTQGGLSSGSANITKRNPWMVGLTALILMAMLALVSHLRSRGSVSIIVVAITCVVFVHSVFAQSINQFHRTFAVSLAEPVALDVDVPKGEVQVLYSHDGQVSVTVTAKPTSIGERNPDLGASIALDQDGNHIKLRYVSNSSQTNAPNNILYRIDVPYRTVVTAKVRDGRLTVTGVMGPVHASTGRGDIKASYISKEVVAEAGSGNLDLQVIGARVEAKAANGNISCSRANQGVSAETKDGDITLMVVGPSIAKVETGSGRINIGGARGSLLAETNSGELHVKAVPQGEWQLHSISGNVRVELPPGATFDVDAASSSGEISLSRDDAKPSGDSHHFHEAVNGGGARIQMSTESGRIAIQ